ncbi:MAG: hypothetical protein H6Q07_1100 [Acidobacteria bacterium]|nr:hypothetical protein [Acidobacteriota bacterium]
MRIPASFVVTSVLALIFPAAGQSFVAAQTQPEVAVSETTERFLTLVAPRQIAEIDRDIESADQAQTVAIEAEQRAQEQRSLAAARIQETRKLIDANTERRKAAKREGKQSEAAVLKTEEKALQREKDMLEQREALRDAEINLARRRNELAILSKQALDLERQLALKRQGQTDASVSSPESARAARPLIDLERTVLEAQKRVADKQGEVAKGAKKVTDRQLRTLEAQQNIYGGR